VCRKGTLLAGVFSAGPYRPDRLHCPEGAGHDQGCACADRLVNHLGFNEFGVRENHTQLVVQAVEEFREGRRSLRVTGPGAGRIDQALGDRIGGVLLFVTRHSHGSRRVAPQRIGEDPDRAARGSHVLHFSCGNPVVDRAAADAHGLTGLHDR